MGKCQNAGTCPREGNHEARVCVYRLEGGTVRCEAVRASARRLAHVPGRGNHEERVCVYHGREMLGPGTYDCVTEVTNRCTMVDHRRRVPL